MQYLIVEKVIAPATAQVKLLAFVQMLTVMGIALQTGVTKFSRRPP